MTNGDKVDEMKKVFSELDKDHSGTLGVDEVTELAKRFFDGRMPTQKRVSKIFRAFDADGDGQVSLDDMLRGAESMHRAFHKSHALHCDNLMEALDEESRFTNPRI